MYIPKNQFTPNLRTDGGAFVDTEGKSYSGPYFSTSYGTYYKGKDPYDKSYGNVLNKRQIFPSSDRSSKYSGGSSRSYPIEASYPISSGMLGTNPQTYRMGNGEGYYQNFDDHEILRKNLPSVEIYSKGGGSIGGFIPISIEPLPTQEDYTNGFFRRYFCVKVNEDIYYELPKETYDDIINNKDGWANSMYIPFNLLWYIKGEKDKIEKLNKELIIQAENKIERFGLDNFLMQEYLKFYRMLPGVNLVNNFGLRRHLDNSSISLNLPKVYQLGNDITYTQNPNVPAKQNCSNCIFNKTQFCSKWKAKIQNNYWCKSYKGKYGEGKVLGGISNIPTPTPPPSTQPSYTPPSSTPPPSGGGGGY